MTKLLVVALCVYGGLRLAHGQGLPISQHTLIVLGVGAALGVLWGALQLYWRWRREQRVKVEQLREQSRYLAARGENVTPAWLITSPNDRVFRDPARQAEWNETLTRRHHGEFEA